MAKHNCAHCVFRKKHDASPQSFLGRLWRWHAGWCPGWKAYMASLDQAKRHTLAKRYGMDRYL